MMRSPASGSRRLLLKAAVAFAGLSGRSTPALSAEINSIRNRMLAVPAEGPQVIVDPKAWPREYQEPPMLVESVSQGRLPPVRERVGLDPLVIAPLHATGVYGGTLRRAFTGTDDFMGATRFSSGPDSLLYWDYSWRRLVPNIARGFEHSSDKRVLTIFLRRGMRWSDGAPFTADDILFWHKDMYSDRRVVPGPSATLELERGSVMVEKVDDFTVQFIAPSSYPMLAEVLAGFSDLAGPALTGRLGMGVFAPKHYLSQFHPRYRSEADISREARAAGFGNWSTYLKYMNDWSRNPELPVVSPWKTVTAINTTVFRLERNPFSIWVDTAGNQLPYIDRVRHTLCSGPDAVNFMAVAGELDFQDRHLDLAKLPYLLSNRQRSKYEVYVDPFEGSDVGIRLNFDYVEDREIGELLRDVRFRRALSMAVDRDAINETLLLGTAIPSAAVPNPDNRYYPGPEWAGRWAQLDLVAANALLDELQLTRRDEQGFRMRRDGTARLQLVCETLRTHFDFPAVAEMVKDQWRAIGVDLNVKIVEVGLFLQRAAAGAIQLTIQVTGSDDPFTYPEVLFPFMPTGSSAIMGASYARWFQSNGRAGKEPPQDLRVVMDVWRQGRAATDEADRIRLGQSAIKAHVDGVLSIGIASAGLTIYGMHLARNNLVNVPRRVVNSQVLRSPVNALPQTFFFRPVAG